MFSTKYRRGGTLTVTVGSDEMPSEQAVSNAHATEKMKRVRARMESKIKEDDGVELKRRFRTRKMGEQ